MILQYQLTMNIHINHTEYTELIIIMTMMTFMSMLYTNNHPAFLFFLLILAFGTHIPEGI